MGAHQYGPLWEPTEVGKPLRPGETPHLLPGPTAWYWQRRATFALFAGTAALLIGLALGLVLNGGLAILGVLVAVVLAIRSFRANVSSYRAIHREQRSGYTTLYGREFHLLWHLDPKTGAVIRRPEEKE